ncbi:MAG TPA: NAD(P)/FAD-dependent oxidoreductase [Dehalococcoidales bacterium]|nr:NAD(P)/FAD-dependent oxidoreductase [Dehalococcoidales bacterium]
MASSRNFYDAAVVGGGPVGSQVAFRLASMGFRTVVLEKKQDLTGPVCCTGIVSTECVDYFDIPDSVIHRTANGARIFTPSGDDFSISRPMPQVAILNRPAFNMAWANRAQGKGAEYRFCAEVTKIDTDKKSVTLQSLCRGEKQSVTARAIILTTGFGSQMVDKAGLGGAADFVMGAQAEVATRDAHEIEVFLGSKTAPGFFGWLVPSAPGKALVGLLSRRSPPAYLRALLAKLAAEGKIMPTDSPFTYGGVTLKPLPKTRADRLLVVGTAAGQVKPLTGGGIYFGLLAADMAANTLNKCLLQDDLSADKLGSYQISWKRRLGRELRVGYWARRIYELLNEGQIDRIAGILESSRLLSELEKSKELSFDWHADVVTRIFDHRVIMKTLGTMKLPFGTKENDGNKAEAKKNVRRGKG